jgi:hypothetical protein
MHSLRGRLSIVFGLLLAASAVPAHLFAQAQATTGVIRGVVRDTSGTRLRGATVTVRNLETNAERTVTTNEQGAFVASLLRVGTYDLTARALGHEEVRRPGLAVHLGETVDLQLALRPQAVAIAGITVTAEAPLVDPTRAEAATRMDDEVVSNLPNNGRNFLNLTLLTPNVSVVQGPDGDEISVGGQRGIHNNYSVDGADFGNPFFGEQRGGQRPAFTFNLDAVQEFVVVSQGANAEFGRSGGGFVNVLTKSGTNDFRGTAHAYGKSDAFSSDYARGGGNPDFSQGQFGFTLGGPLRRDRAFFFMALDHQEFEQTKQTDPNRIADARLRAFVDTAFGGALASDYGPITRTNDATAFLLKLDLRLSGRHQASLKYNYTHSRQENGTFDVDAWARSSNGVERDFSHALNGSLSSVLSNSVSNEFRFQVSREDRPRDYLGPNVPGTDHPFPDTGMDFAAGYRLGLPFFLPIDAYDTRLQLLDNVSLVRGDHFFKVGAEWNRTEANQTFIGFASGRFIFGSVEGFLNYVRYGPGYVECSGGTTSLTGSCPTGLPTGPVILYLQQVGVNGRTVEDAGTQSLPQNEFAFYAQDTWKPNARLTLNYGLRWEAQIQPDVLTPPDEVFFAPFIGQSVTTPKGTFEFPSDGEIPSDTRMFQPRLGVAYDIDGDGRQVLRGSAGLYYARVPGLVLASTRSTNGSIGQTLFRNSALTGILGPPPEYGELLPAPTGVPFFPGVFVFDKDFRNPRTLALNVGYEREIATGYSAGLSYAHSRTDFLTRFVDRNDTVFGSPWGSGLAPGGANGIGVLTVVESSARSRYHGVTLELKGQPSDALQFQANYTMSWDKSDDDNERDPFSFRYARADRLDAEYGYSDRDQRHRFNGWLLARLPYQIYTNHRISFASAQPMSEKCGAGNAGTGERAASPAERICPNGSILERNTLRKENEYFSWDIRLSRAFRFGERRQLEAILDVFNVTNSDNFRDPAASSLLFNFDGTVRGGLGDPRQAQLGVRFVF